MNDVLDKESATIEHLLITHWHHDHIGGVPSIQNLLKSKNSNEASVWKLPRSPEDTEISEEKPIDCQYLVNDQLVVVEGAKLQVKYTPGHTSDHYCLLMKEENVLFSGDCILGEGTAVFEDLYDYMNSLEHILNMKLKLIYPGHGPVIDDPIQRIKYYIDHRKRREQEILKILKEKNKPMSEIEIVKHVYRVSK